MNDEEFTTFMAQCNLSNEEIAKEMEVSTDTVRRYRNGTAFPADNVRRAIVRRLSLLEMTRLGEEIGHYEEKRKTP